MNSNLITVIFLLSNLKKLRAEFSHSYESISLKVSRCDLLSELGQKRAVNKGKGSRNRQGHRPIRHLLGERQVSMSTDLRLG